MFTEYQDGLRDLAEQRMNESSRATIRRATGQTAQDESTGLEVPVWEITHADLPMRLGGSRNAATTRTEDVAGVEVQTALRVAHFPASTANLADGDLIEITAGENAGDVLRIIEAAWQDQATARRVPVESVHRPEEW